MKGDASLESSPPFRVRLGGRETREGLGVGVDVKGDKSSFFTITTSNVGSFALVPLSASPFLPVIG